MTKVKDLEVLSTSLFVIVLTCSTLAFRAMPVHAQQTAKEGSPQIFNVGQLSDITMKVNQQCKQQNLDAQLVNIEYVNGPEVPYYTAIFRCGKGPDSFTATFKPADYERLKDEIGTYCQGRNKSTPAFSTEPAPTANISKVSVECK